MSHRPPWVLRLVRFIDDEIMEDPSWPADGADDDLSERIVDAVNKILCDHYGHEIIDDQCNKPEHRFCVWCGRRASDIAR
jgi:hypothetical protein